MRALVVEDSAKAGRILEKGLTEFGFSVDVARTAKDAELRAASGNYDVVILDRMLPDDDGLELCQRVRRKGIATPILMLTALSETAEKVAGLEAGADDYVAKPFEFAELVARIRALLRRGQAHDAVTLSFENVRMNLLLREVVRGDRPLKLTAKEFSVLEFFLRNPNRVLSRTLISEHVWNLDFDSESNVIDVYVSGLRRKLEMGGEPRLIHTIIGAGYILRNATTD